MCDRFYRGGPFCSTHPWAALKRPILNRLYAIYRDIEGNVETILNTSNYELDRSLPKGRNEKVIGLMNDELGGKIIAKFVGLRAKDYSYLINDDSEDEKKQKEGTQKNVL